MQTETQAQRIKKITSVSQYILQCEGKLCRTNPAYIGPRHLPLISHREPYGEDGYTSASEDKLLCATGRNGHIIIIIRLLIISLLIHLSNL